MCKINGITLVALVVTIVVLLILAGITILYVMGDNGVFGKASQAKLKTDIANWQERLETAKTPNIIDGLGTFNPDKYFDYIEQQGIINSKATDVINNGDGTYDVTTKPGYVFLVTLMPNLEKSTDAKIEYIGQAGKILPIIRKIEASATSTSITGKAIVARLGTSGTVEYYYKLETEEEKDYKRITKVNTEIGATQDSNIVAGTKYIIKVVAKNEVGEVSATQDITATKIFVSSVTITPDPATIKVGKTITLTAEVKPENSTNKTLKWESSDSSKATVTENADGTVTVTGVADGTVIITATATDGSGQSGSCSIMVPASVTGISLNKSTAKVEAGKTITLTATISPANAEDKSVTWNSSNKAVATVSQTGVVTPVTGVTSGTTTITVTSNDDTTKTASCTVTVIEESDWAEIAEMAKVIANDSRVTNSSFSATVQVNGANKTIRVGEILKVKYNGNLMKVRVLGFKHDDLVYTGAYGGNHTKASISFEFVDIITTNAMYGSTIEGSTNENGWVSSWPRAYYFNKGGWRANFSNNSYIKMVKKQYICKNDSTYKVETCNDYFWLLSCSEVLKDGKYGNNSRGYAITQEGAQYRYYQYYGSKTYDSDCDARVKNFQGQPTNWWLRSAVFATYWRTTCFINAKGNGGSCQGSDSAYGIAPGFCI